MFPYRLVGSFAHILVTVSSASFHLWESIVWSQVACPRTVSKVLRCRGCQVHECCFRRLSSWSKLPCNVDILPPEKKPRLQDRRSGGHSGGLEVMRFLCSEGDFRTFEINFLLYLLDFLIGPAARKKTTPEKKPQHSEKNPHPLD